MWSKDYNLEDLTQLASLVTQEISTHKEFCVWLDGPLGAGKTTTTGSLLKALGLPQDENVPSPTFTYLIEYEIKGQWFAHMDLYRIKKELDEPMDMMKHRDYKGSFIEWPDNSPDLNDIYPTHKILIEYLTPSSRKFTFYQNSEI